MSDFVKYTLVLSAGRNDCQRLNLSRLPGPLVSCRLCQHLSRHYRRHVRADLSEQRQRRDRQLREKLADGSSRPGWSTSFP